MKDPPRVPPTSSPTLTSNVLDLMIVLGLLVFIDKQSKHSRIVLLPGTTCCQGGTKGQETGSGYLLNQHACIRDDTTRFEIVTFQSSGTAVARWIYVPADQKLSAALMPQYSSNRSIVRLIPPMLPH